MNEIVNNLLVWFGWQTPDTVSLLIENVVRVAIGLGIVLFIFKGVYRLAGIHNII